MMVPLIRIERMTYCLQDRWIIVLHQRLGAMFFTGGMPWNQRSAERLLRVLPAGKAICPLHSEPRLKEEQQPMRLTKHVSLKYLAIACASAGLGGLGGYVFGTHGYPVDWASTGTMVQGLAAMIAALAAAVGIDQWRRELSYKRNAELAEHMLTAAEALASDLRVALRAPASIEFRHDFAVTNLLTYQAFTTRSDVISRHSHMAEIEAAGHRVAALFGVAHRDALGHLLQVAYEVRDSLGICRSVTRAVDEGLAQPEILASIQAIASQFLPETEAGTALRARLTQSLAEMRSLFDRQL